jgi:hypothetical protein
VDSDLKYIFADCEIEPGTQYVLANAGYQKVRRLVGLGEDRRAVRARLRDQLGLDSDANVVSAQKVASVLDAWEVAGKQQEKEVTMRAEARALNLPRPVQQLERGAMRNAVENAHGRKPDREIPGPSFVAAKMQEIENNDIRAAKLEEMVSLSDDEDDGISAGVDNAGVIKIVGASRKKIKPPLNSEELRTRLRVDCNVWLFGQTKHTNRRWLADLLPGTYERIIDYLSGDKVAKLVITVPGKGDDGSNEMRLTPPWYLVLAYEFQLRKHAAKEVKDNGKSLNQALLDAMSNTEIKETYFTTPLALLPAAAKKNEQGWGWQPKWPRNDSNWWSRDAEPKGKGKGKSGKGRKGAKGKGKDKGDKGGPLSLLSKAPGGRLICFNWNDPNKGCSGECGMLHICRVRGCGAEHMFTKCPKLGLS